MGKIVGIDLGTTFSAIAHINKYGEPEIIPNWEGEKTTPSVIRLSNPVVVGRDAARNALAFHEEIVTNVKSYMGRSEFPKTLDGEECLLDGKPCSADTLSSLILRKLKADAENFLREDITGACITVPVVFDDLARNATMNAAKLAEFEEVILIDEPTASAYAYLKDQKLSEDQKMLVFDLGGGTNDVSLLEISGTVIKVVSKNGDRELGGRHWDKALIEDVCKAFGGQIKGREARHYLEEDVVRVKHLLSGGSPSTKLSTRYLKEKPSVTRAYFESLTVDLVGMCKAQCEIALTEGKMKWDDVDTVLLVGGSTRMPMIREAIAEISEKEISLPPDPDIAVALGAAIRGEDKLNPSQSAVNEPKTELINITSKPLGIVVRTDSGKYVVDVMIPIGKKIPCKVQRGFPPEEPGQKSAEIVVVQGLENGDRIDFKKIDENPHVIGRLTLKMPPAVQADASIQVVYKYNSDEIFEVEARGPDGRTVKVEIKTPGLDPEEFKETAKVLRSQKIV